MVGVCAFLVMVFCLLCYCFVLLFVLLFCVTVLCYCLFPS
jgi:hypothetical protein